MTSSILSGLAGGAGGGNYVGGAIIRLLLDAAQFEAGLRTAEGRLAAASRRLDNVGTKLTRNVTLPIIALGAGAIKVAMDFETAFAGVEKTVDGTAAQFQKLETGIRDMAKHVPASVEAIAGVAEQAGQLGIKIPSILSFTRTMIDLGESTNLSADQAADALARLANITKMPQSEFDRLGSTIVALGNAGASTEAEITEMGLRIAGAGDQVGLTQAQIVAFASALASVGIRAEAGGSAISKVFISLAQNARSGGEDLQTIARLAGMTGEAFQTAFAKDAAGATISFIEGLGKLKKEGGDVFGVLEDLGFAEVRVRDALLRASGAGDLFRESIKTGSAAWKENTALTEEANKRYQTSAARLRIMWNRFKDIAITFGQDLLPAARDVLEIIGGWLQSFNDLDPATRNLFIKGALSVAVLGPVIKLLAGGAAILAQMVKAGKALAGMSILQKILGGTPGVPLPGVPGAPRPPAVPGVPPVAPVGAASVLAPAAGVILAGVLAKRAADPKSDIRVSASQHAVDQILDDMRLTEKTILSTSEALATYMRLQGNSADLTEKQSNKLRVTIDRFGLLGVELDEQSKKTAENLLKVGDFAGAMDILNKAYDDNVKKLDGGTRALGRFGGSADLQRAKVDLLREGINKLPTAREIKLRMNTIEARRALEAFIASVRNAHLTMNLNLNAGGPTGVATGGVIAGATGFVTRRTTLMVGEGGYHTPFGRGAEAVLPLTSDVLQRLGRAIASANGGSGDTYIIDARDPGSEDRIRRMLESDHKRTYRVTKRRKDDR